jgi:ELWxxDGT repeat protein
MRNIVLLIIFIILGAVLFSCLAQRNKNNAANNATFAGDLSTLGLTAQAQNASTTSTTVGQSINFQYVVKNTGTVALAGPVTVADDKVGAVNCPAVNTQGNQDNNLDAAESITCSAAYAITQADINNGTVTTHTTATAAGVTSNTITTNVPLTLQPVLNLKIVANPTTYNQAQQTVTFTYTITNTGPTALGPAQFIIHDDHLGSFNCGDATTTVQPNQSFNCQGTYTTTQNDVGAAQIVFNVSASGAGAGTPQATAVTVANTALSSNPSSPANLTPGSTIKHQVNAGEWMLQITRCYGADFEAVRNANPQIADPDLIFPDTDVLTIPNIGSNGKIYGPPCVTYYTVQAGDTWESIAQKYNADIAVLKYVNKDLGFGTGVKLKIPLNSAGGNPVPVPTGQTNQAIRITFPQGQNAATVTGSVGPNKTRVRYVLTASQGQTLSIQLTAPATEVALGVVSINGSAVKTQDSNLTWSGTVPANGDYYIDVVNTTGADKLYSLTVGLAAPQGSAAFQRVADINTGAPDSNPSYLAVFNNVLYFNATGFEGTGAELWKFDAATQTASQVRDINPGANGSNPSYLAAYNNALYFSANGSDGGGVELWRFNGTDTGRLTDINTGTGDSNPSYMTVFNNLLYFSANGNDGAGVELWKTDGTTASRVTDIYAGSGDANPSYLTVFNNALYFSATSNDGAGTELWKFDGTTPTRVADINAGVGNSYPAYLTVFNLALYFSANGNDGHGVEIWKYDGTNAPIRVTDVNNGPGDSIPTYLTVFNNALYFAANGNDNAGFELWKFDGTNATRVSDLNKAGDTSPAYMTVYNNELYFSANGGDGAGRELWKYKGP